jgi:hypothetical protein
MAKCRVGLMSRQRFAKEKKENPLLTALENVPSQPACPEEPGNRYIVLAYGASERTYQRRCTTVSYHYLFPKPDLQNHVITSLPASTYPLIS